MISTRSSACLNFDQFRGVCVRACVCSVQGKGRPMADVAITNGPLLQSGRIVYKVVLTGGPCAGKTTTLARLRVFFENLGWKVYAIPETATILLGCGVKFSELSPVQAKLFQTSILTTLLEVEKTFFQLADHDTGNVLIVCDRGSMDPFAFCNEEERKEMLACVHCDKVQLRDNRYDQVVHMVTAASGAEKFYQLNNNAVRSEGFELALERDARAADSWLGHPYFDVVDNVTESFEEKINNAIGKVCKGIKMRGVKLELDDDRLQPRSKKRKFLIKSLPDIKEFPSTQDFYVKHDYIVSINDGVESRIRKRGQKGSESFTYTITERKMVNGEKVECVRPLSNAEYETLSRHKYPHHNSVEKTRRCFLWNRQYFQLDIFKACTERCRGLLLLETYTTKQGDNLKLPDFLEVVKEVTNEPEYSMFQLSDTSIE